MGYGKKKWVGGVGKSGYFFLSIYYPVGPVCVVSGDRSPVFGPYRAEFGREGKGGRGKRKGGE